METITTEMPCEICGQGILFGEIAQVPGGYVCEKCVFKYSITGCIFLWRQRLDCARVLARSELVHINATQKGEEHEL